MNKRIRKKQLKRALIGLAGLVAAYEEYEAARERVCERAYCKALQDLIDAQGKSHEESMAALRCYLGVVSLIAFSGPPPRFLAEMRSSVHPSPQN